MTDLWENQTYCKHWMDTPRKKPNYVRFKIVPNEKNEPDMIFRFSLQPPLFYDHPNYANSLYLMLGNSDFVRQFSAIWLQYCNMGFALDDRIKKNNDIIENGVFKRNRKPGTGLK